MSLSSSSLIHLTKTKQNLKGILKESFKIKYCLEKIYTLSKTFECYSPMVCFCDIPLSEIKNHLKKYGNYGIGLKKNWGEENGLNPVLYIDKKSTLGKQYITGISESLKGKKLKELSEFENNSLEVMRYMKNYEGTLIRKGKLINEKYRFSDEREWRYLPSRDIVQMIVTKKFYEKESNESIKRLKAELGKLRLEFVPNDIKYIIIKNEGEIPEFINVLRSSKGDKYSQADIERLMTRIITVDQISTDF